MQIQRELRSGGSNEQFLERLMAKAGHLECLICCKLLREHPGEEVMHCSRQLPSGTLVGRMPENNTSKAPRGTVGDIMKSNL